MTDLNLALAPRFIDLARQGLSLTSICADLGVLKEDLLAFVENSVEFRRIFKQGMQLNQAYHEKILDLMINGVEPYEKASAKQIEAQQFRLKTMFNEDWNTPSKASASESSNLVIDLTDDQINEQLAILLENDDIRALLANLSD